MDNATYRSLNKVDTLTASNVLRRLRDAGLFTQQGRGSATWCQPTVKLQGEAAGPVGGAGDGDGLAPNSPGLSPKLRALSSKPLIPPAEQLRRAELMAALPAALAGRLSPWGNRRPPREVRDLVANLCAWQHWHAEDLAILLQRRAEVSAPGLPASPAPAGPHCDDAARAAE